MDTGVIPDPGPLPSQNNTVPSKSYSEVIQRWSDRGTQQRIQHYSPHTPNNQWRGRGGQRGKRGGRGHPRGQPYQNNISFPRDYNNSPYHPPSRESSSSYYQNQGPQYQEGMPSTQSRDAPLRDMRDFDITYNGHASPPYPYNQPTNNYEQQGFYKDPYTRKRGQEPREGAEGEGDYKGGKRRRL